MISIELFPSNLFKKFLSRKLNENNIPPTRSLIHHQRKVKLKVMNDFNTKGCTNNLFLQKIGGQRIKKTFWEQTLIWLILMDTSKSEKSRRLNLLSKVYHLFRRIIWKRKYFSLFILEPSSNDKQIFDEIELLKKRVSKLEKVYGIIRKNTSFDQNVSIHEWLFSYEVNCNNENHE